MLRTNLCTLVAAMAMAVLIAAPVAHAVDYTWDNEVGDGAWATPDNWTANDTTYPDAADDTATFGDVGVGDVNLGADQTVGSVTLQNTTLGGGYAIKSDAETLTTGTLAQTGTAATTVNTVKAKLRGASDALSLNVGSGTLTLGGQIGVLGTPTTLSGTVGGTVRAEGAGYTAGSLTVNSGGTVVLAHEQAMGSTKMVLAGGTLSSDLVPPIVAYENLKGYWALDEGSGGTAANTGNNSNIPNAVLQDSSPDWVAGKFGSAVDVQDKAMTVDYFKVGDDHDFSGDFTFSFWVQTDEGMSGWPRYFGNKDGWSNTQGWEAERANGSGRVAYRMQGGGSTTVNVNSAMPGTFEPSDDWYLLTFVAETLATSNSEKKHLTFYADGVEISNSTFSFRPQDDKAFCIGGGEPDGANQVDARFDDIRFYDAALDSTQVAAVYNGGAGDLGGVGAGPADFTSIDVEVTAAGSAVDAGDDLLLGNLTMAAGTDLATGTTEQKTVSFATLGLAGAATLTADGDMTVRGAVTDGDPGSGYVVAKAGAGTLYLEDLTGTTNTDEITWSIQAGALDFLVNAGASALGGAALDLDGGNVVITAADSPTVDTPINVNASGTIEVASGSVTVGGTSGIDVDAGQTVTLQVDSGAGLTVAGAISGDGNVVVNDLSGTTVTMTADNPYTGTTDVDAGTLAITHAGALGDGTVTVKDQATLNVNAADVDLSALVVNAGALVMLSQTQDLGAAPTAGIAGTLQSAVGTVAGYDLTFEAGSTLDIVAGTGPVTIAGALTLSGDMTMNAGLGDTLKIEGGASGTGGITKTGDGDLNLGALGGAALTYQGATIAQGGNLFVLAPVTGTSEVQVQGGVLTANAQLDSGGPITVTGGDLIASAAVSAGGDVTIQGGNLTVNATGSLDAGANDVSVTGGNVNADAGITAGLITLNGGAFNANAVGAANADVEVNGGSFVLNIAGAMAAGKTLYLNTGGTVEIGADGAMAGVSMVNNGVWYINVTAEQSAGNFPALNITPGACLGGDLDNAVYGTEVVFDDGAVLAPNLDLTSNIPTTADLNEGEVDEVQIYAGMVTKDATYTVGSDGNAGTTDDIYGKGIAMGAWTLAGDFTGTIDQYTGVTGDIEVVMNGLELTLGDGTTAATLDLTDPTTVSDHDGVMRRDEIFLNGGSKLTINNAWLGDAEVVRFTPETGAVGVGEFAQLTDDVVLELTGPGVIGAGQSVIVTKGQVDMQDTGAVAGDLYVEGGARIDLRDPATSGTYHISGMDDALAPGGILINGLGDIDGTAGGTMVFDDGAMVGLDFENFAISDTSDMPNNVIYVLDDANIDQFLIMELANGGGFYASGYQNADLDNATHITMAASAVAGDTVHFGAGSGRTLYLNDWNTDLTVDDNGTPADLSDDVMADVTINGAHYSLAGNASIDLSEASGRVYTNKLWRSGDMVIEGGEFEFADNDNASTIGSLTINQGGFDMDYASALFTLPGVVQTANTDASKWMTFEGDNSDADIRDMIRDGTLGSEWILGNNTFVEIMFQKGTETMPDGTEGEFIDQKITLQGEPYLATSGDWAGLTMRIRTNDGSGSKRAYFRDVHMDAGAGGYMPTLSVWRDSNDDTYFNLTLHTDGTTTRRLWGNNRASDRFDFGNVVSIGNNTLFVGEIDPDPMDALGYNWINHDVWGQLGDAGGDLTINLVNGGLTFWDGSGMDADTVINQTAGVAGTPGGLPEGANGSTEFWSATGKNASATFTGGTLNLAGGENVRFRVARRNTSTDPANVYRVDTAINVWSDGDDESVDAVLYTNRTTNGANEGIIHLTDVNLGEGTILDYVRESEGDLVMDVTVGGNVGLWTGATINNTASGDHLIVGDVDGTGVLFFTGTQKMGIMGEVTTDIVWNSTQELRLTSQDAEWGGWLNLRGTDLGYDPAGLDLNGNWLSILNGSAEIWAAMGSGNIETLGKLEIWYGKNDEDTVGELGWGDANLWLYPNAFSIEGTPTAGIIELRVDEHPDSVSGGDPYNTNWFTGGVYVENIVSGLDGTLRGERADNKSGEGRVIFGNTWLATGAEVNVESGNNIEVWLDVGADTLGATDQVFLNSTSNDNIMIRDVFGVGEVVLGGPSNWRAIGQLDGTVTLVFDGDNLGMMTSRDEGGDFATSFDLNGSEAIVRDQRTADSSMVRLYVNPGVGQLTVDDGGLRVYEGQAGATWGTGLTIEVEGNGRVDPETFLPDPNRLMFLAKEDIAQNVNRFEGDVLVTDNAAVDVDAIIETARGDDAGGTAGKVQLVDVILGNGATAELREQNNVVLEIETLSVAPGGSGKVVNNDSNLIFISNLSGAGDLTLSGTQFFNLDGTINTNALVIDGQAALNDGVVLGANFLAGSGFDILADSTLSVNTALGGDYTVRTDGTLVIGDAGFSGTFVQEAGSTLGLAAEVDYPGTDVGTNVVIAKAAYGEDPGTTFAIDAANINIGAIFTNDASIVCAIGGAETQLNFRGGDTLLTIGDGTQSNQITGGRNVVIDRDLAFASPNDYTGGTVLESGTTTILDGAGDALGTGTVVLQSPALGETGPTLANYQANFDSGLITVNTDTTLALYADLASDIEFAGGTVEGHAADDGNVTASGDVTDSGDITLATFSTLTMAGDITLTGDRTWTIGDGSEVIWTGDITSTGWTLTKADDGTLTLSGANTMPNLVIGTQEQDPVTFEWDDVPGGQVIVTAAGAAPADVVIRSGSLYSVEVADHAYTEVDVASSSGVVALGADNNQALSLVGSDNLFLGATGDWEYSGALTANDDSMYLLGGGGGVLDVTGPLTGTNDVQIGWVTGEFHDPIAHGSVILSNASNSFVGTVDVYFGLGLGADGAIPAGNTVNVYEGGAFDLNGFTYDLNDVNMLGGGISSSGSTLTKAQLDALFVTPVPDPGDYIIGGPGSGNTAVEDGALWVGTKNLRKVGTNQATLADASGSSLNDYAAWENTGTVEEPVWVARGTYVEGGTLTVPDATSLGQSATLEVHKGATLELAGGAQFIAGAGDPAGELKTVKLGGGLGSDPVTLRLGDGAVLETNQLELGGDVLVEAMGGGTTRTIMVRTLNDSDPDPLNHFYEWDYLRGSGTMDVIDGTTVKINPNRAMADNIFTIHDGGRLEFWGPENNLGRVGTLMPGGTMATFTHISAPGGDTDQSGMLRLSEESRDPADRSSFANPYHIEINAPEGAAGGGYLGWRPNGDWTVRSMTHYADEALGLPELRPTAYIQIDGEAGSKADGFNGFGIGRNHYHEANGNSYKFYWIITEGHELSMRTDVTGPDCIGAQAWQWLNGATEWTKYGYSTAINRQHLEGIYVESGASLKIFGTYGFLGEQEWLDFYPDLPDFDGDGWVPGELYMEDGSYLTARNSWGGITLGFTNTYTPEGGSEVTDTYHAYPTIGASTTGAVGAGDAYTLNVAGEATVNFRSGIEVEDGKLLTLNVMDTATADLTCDLTGTQDVNGTPVTAQPVEDLLKSLNLQDRGNANLYHSQNNIESTTILNDDSVDPTAGTLTFDPGVGNTLTYRNASDTSTMLSDGTVRVASGIVDMGSTVIASNPNLIDFSGLTVGGLTGDYYTGVSDATVKNYNWGSFNLLASQVDAPVIDFTGGFPMGLSSNWAVRWSGVIEITQAMIDALNPGGLSADITFETRSDDGSVIWINGDVVVDNDGNHGAQTRTGTVNLAPGFYAFEMGYHQGGGGGTMLARWDIGSGYETMAGQYLYNGNYTYSITGDIDVQAGATLKIGGFTDAAVVSIGEGATLEFQSVASDCAQLAMAALSTFDIADASVLVSETDYASLYAKVVEGRGSGDWLGTGITSSNAAADPVKYGVGIAAKSEGTLVKYTLMGDANLDGSVDTADYFALSAVWFQAGEWQNGDFNYDGVVDTADYFAMSNNWFQSLSGSVGDGAAPQMPVPEPATLALMGLGLAGLAGLRRRRTRKNNEGSGRKATLLTLCIALVLGIGTVAGASVVTVDIVVDTPVLQVGQSTTFTVWAEVVDNQYYDLYDLGLQAASMDLLFSVDGVVEIDEGWVPVPPPGGPSGKPSVTLQPAMGTLTNKPAYQNPGARSGLSNYFVSSPLEAGWDNYEADHVKFGNALHTGPVWLVQGTLTAVAEGVVTLSSQIKDGLNVYKMDGDGLYQGPADQYVLNPADVQVIPEPATLALLGLGLVGLIRRR